MRNHQQFLTESAVTEVSYFSQITQNNLSCPFKNHVTHVCMNKKCNKNSFLCSQQGCNCVKQHNKCFKITLKSLIENIEQKQVLIESLQSCISNGIQEIIDFLSNYRDETIKKLKNDFEFFGLNENEKRLMRGLKNEKCEKITGSIIWDIIHSELQKENVTKLVEEACKSLEKHFQKAKQSFDSIVKDTKETINSLDSQVQKCYNSAKNNITLINPVINLSSSKILTSLNQFSTLESFLTPKSIKPVKIIYRASENGYQAKKFHQKCDGVPDTLILVETEYGKKIGGFTPIKWNSQGDYVKDESMSSFVFSLTNNDKFQLTNKQKAVKHNLSCGPIFSGGGHDLWIYDKANQNAVSNANMNEGYFNEKYKKDDNQSWTSFCGNPSGKNFKTKQWQVWSLSFH